MLDEHGSVSHAQCVPNTLQERHGRLLREARERANLSQEELAAAIEINRSNVSRAEHGLIALDDDNRVKAAEALGCRVEDIWSYPDTTREAY